MAGVLTHSEFQKKQSGINPAFETGIKTDSYDAKQIVLGESLGESADADGCVKPQTNRVFLMCHPDMQDAEGKIFHVNGKHIKIGKNGSCEVSEIEDKDLLVKQGFYFVGERYDL